tara:strand:+ start:8100 stop:8432 length:333 start_codon:yes stop_codon:yes gene_type:complete
MKHWFLAALKWSEKMGQPFYSTSLRTYEAPNKSGQQRVMQPAKQQVDGAPQCQVYFGSGVEDHQRADKFAYIYTGPETKDNYIMSEDEYKASATRKPETKTASTASAKTT